MVQEITAGDLARHLINGHAPLLLDVRQPWENELAALPDSKLIPLNDLAARLDELASHTNEMVVVYCHHGVRSRNAAAFLQGNGFTKVLSLAGGIDAWSCEADPAVPRY